jgi:hypothetical protein
LVPSNPLSPPAPVPADRVYSHSMFLRKMLPINGNSHKMISRIQRVEMFAVHGAQSIGLTRGGILVLSNECE